MAWDRNRNRPESSYFVSGGIRVVAVLFGCFGTYWALMGLLNFRYADGPQMLFAGLAGIFTSFVGVGLATGLDCLFYIASRMAIAAGDSDAKARPRTTELTGP